MKGSLSFFKVPPYAKGIAQSLRKKPKYYFYNWALVKNNKGVCFENFVACCLLKENHFREDTKGDTRNLFYLRDKDKHEIDFLLTEDKKPIAMIEAKWRNDNLSPHFKIFSKFFKKIKKIQLVKDLRKEKTYPDGSEI